MRLSICPCFCCVFTGFDAAVRHRLWGSIWHALGSNSAGVPLFCKHASRMRSSAMSAYTRRYVQLSAMRLSIHAFSCFFYGFPSCCSAPRLGINLARLGLEFCWGSAVSQACLTDAFIGYVRLDAPICPSISAMMRLYNAFVHVFAVFFTGFEDAVRHRLWGSIWHALGSNSAGVPLFRKHASRMRSSAMSTCHAPKNDPLSAMRLLYARFCCVFTGFEDAVRHRLWGLIWHTLGSNSAGVPLFRKRASGTRSSAMSTYAPICPAQSPCAYYTHAFALFLRVSMML